MSGVSHWIGTEPGNDFRPADSLPLTDRGFRYGMAVFETIGVSRGRLLFLAEHLACIRHAVAQSHFPVEAAWLQRAGEHLASILAPSDHGVARLHVTAGDGSPTDRVTAPRVLLSFEQRAPVAAEIRARGYQLLTCPTEFFPTLAGRKTHNYWANAAALMHVRAVGADEGVVVGPHGFVLSGCMANLFLVTAGGNIITPAAQDGARAGVVRRWVLERRNVQVTRLQRNDLSGVIGAFLTSSWLGVMPVAAIDGKNLPEMSVSSQLVSEYHCIR